MDKRTLKQRIHDSEVKWDCYMRAHAWARAETMDKASVLWLLKQKAAGHEALLENYAKQYRWWHRLLGVKKPEPRNLFRNMVKIEDALRVQKSGT